MYSRYIREHILPRFAHEHYFSGNPDPRCLEAIDSVRAAFPFPQHIDFREYIPKSMHRYKLAYAHFPDAFSGVVGDIGDRNGSIRSLVQGTVVTADKNNARLESFDWDISTLPFEDGKFHSVFCLDTLEHVADIHTRFADLLRTTSMFAVVSLPNCWKKSVKELMRGRSVRSSYGLPVEKPKDRHRWYMNTEEIEDFLFYNAAKNGFSVDGIVYNFPRSRWWHYVAAAARPIIPERYFKNLLVATVCVKLRRVGSS